MTVTTDTATTRLRNYVGGEWVDAGGAEFHDVINPATGDVVAVVPYSTANHLDEAVRAARQALPAWRGVSTIARARLLFTLREKLQARKDEIARSVVIEMGKTLPDATAEVGRMIEMVEAATAIPTTMQGKVLEDVARGVDAETIRQPVGVCGIIAPFNFPAMVPFWFLPFAIACGNTVVLKPSEQVPMTQQMVFGVIDERMEGEVRITVVATGFTSTPSSSLESEEGGFSLGALKEEISFGSPLRDMDLEPAIFRRKHSSSERNF